MSGPSAAAGEAPPLLLLVSPGHPAAAVLRAAGLHLLERDGPMPALPAGATLLAVAAPDAEAAARLAAGLGEDLPRLIGEDPLPALLPLLVARLGTANAIARQAEAGRVAALRALGGQPPPLPAQVLAVPPDGTALASPQRLHLPLGRAAEGISAIELLVEGAAPGAALRLRLSAAGRVLAAWAVPAAALTPGWLWLDLPEPAPPGAAEAVLDVALEGEAGALRLSAGSAGATLALRLHVAAPGRHVLPLHAEWAAMGHAFTPGVALSVPEAALAGATLEGAAAAFVAAGAEAPRLLVELAPGAAATLTLPPVPQGAADLARLEIFVRSGAAAALEATLALGTPPAAALRRSAPARPDAEGRLRLFLPLPPAPDGMARLALLLRHTGEAPLAVEVVDLALMAGAAGEARPSAAPAPAPSRPRPLAVPLPGTPPAPRFSAALPSFGPAAGFRMAPPQPPLAEGAPPSAPPLALPPAPRLEEAAAARIATGFLSLKLHQHLVNDDGSYRHLEVTLTNLVATAGLWRQVRFKLFERQGVVGLEFRSMRGWPQMFDVWPGSLADAYGPFWRLQTDRAAEALALLGTPYDRSLIAAVLEVLPGLAPRAGGEAGLSRTEQDDWAARARRLAEAVAAARAGSQPRTQQGG